jgi:Ca2+-binding EF-hand superfamily protein
MISTTGEQQEESRVEKEKDERLYHIAKLQQLFNAIDKNGDGKVEPRELDAFFLEHEAAKLAADQCGMPVRDLREALYIMSESCTSSHLDIDHFVHCLAEMGQVATHKTIMTLSSKFHNMTLDIHRSLDALKQHTSDQVESLSSKLALQMETKLHEMEQKMEKALMCKLSETDACIQKFASQNEVSLDSLSARLERREVLDGSFPPTAAQADQAVLLKSLEELLSELRNREAVNGKFDEQDPNVLKETRKTSALSAGSNEATLKYGCFGTSGVRPGRARCDSDPGNLSTEAGSSNCHYYTLDTQIRDVTGAAEISIGKIEVQLAEMMRNLPEQLGNVVKELLQEPGLSNRGMRQMRRAISK